MINVPVCIQSAATPRRDFERDQIMRTVDEWRSKSMAGAMPG